jgi:hypothetical protein
MHTSECAILLLWRSIEKLLTPQVPLLPLTNARTRCQEESRHSQTNSVFQIGCVSAGIHWFLTNWLTLSLKIKTPPIWFIYAGSLPMSHRDAGPTIAAQKSRKKCAKKSRLNMMNKTQHTILSLFLFQLQGRMWLVGTLTSLHNYCEATLFAWSCLTFKLPSISLRSSR